MTTIMFLFCSISLFSLACSALPTRIKCDDDTNIGDGPNCDDESWARLTANLSGVSSPTTISGVPQRCLGDQKTLDHLDGFGDLNRVSCDAWIAHLTRESSAEWVMVVIEPQCMFNVTTDFENSVNGQRSAIQAKEDTECQQNVQDLTKEERKTWVGGMLPPSCPYDRDDPEYSGEAEAPFGELGMKERLVCDSMLRSLVAFADLHWSEDKVAGGF